MPFSNSFVDLRVNLAAIFDGALDALRRRKRGELDSAHARKSSAPSSTPLPALEVIRCSDRKSSVRQVGEADATVDGLVLLPEAALELQPDLDGGSIGHCIDGFCSWPTIHLHLAQHRERDGAHAPIGPGVLADPASLGVNIGDGDALFVLGDLGDLGVVPDKLAPPRGQTLARSCPCPRSAGTASARIRSSAGS